MRQPFFYVPKEPNMNNPGATLIFYREFLLKVGDPSLRSG
jgi:hypothetical protein